MAGQQTGLWTHTRAPTAPAGHAHHYTAPLSSKMLVPHRVCTHRAGTTSSVRMSRVRDRSPDGRCYPRKAQRLRTQSRGAARQSGRVARSAEGLGSKQVPGGCGKLLSVLAGKKFGLTGRANCRAAAAGAAAPLAAASTHWAGEAVPGRARVRRIAQTNNYWATGAAADGRHLPQGQACRAGGWRRTRCSLLPPPSGAGAAKREAQSLSARGRATWQVDCFFVGVEANRLDAYSLWGSRQRGAGPEVGRELSSRRKRESARLRVCRRSAEATRHGERGRPMQGWE